MEPKQILNCACNFSMLKDKHRIKIYSKAIDCCIAYTRPLQVENFKIHSYMCIVQSCKLLWRTLYKVVILFWNKWKKRQKEEAAKTF